MTAREARLENDLPSVVEANDLDAQTAENLRGTTYSHPGKLVQSVGQADSAIGETIAKSAVAELGNVEAEGHHKTLESVNGFWKGREKIESSIILKCFDNSWADRQEQAKEKLGGHIDNLVPKEHRERMKEIHDALVEGNLTGLRDSIGNIPPHQLRDYLKDINQHLKDSDSDVRMTVTSRGHVLLYSKDNSSAVEFDQRTGETRERAIVGMTKSIPPQLVFGDVEPGDPKEALGRIGDEVTRDATFGKEDFKPLPRIEPIRPRWDWEDPIWRKPHWRPDETPDWRKPTLKPHDELPDWWKEQLKQQRKDSYLF
jgi:hypothetical protein